jgi:hypothetical protein
MKQYLAPLLALVVLSTSSCDLFEKAEDDANVLGGSPDTSLTAVGTSYYVSIGSSGSSTGLKFDTAYISESANGIIKVRIKANTKDMDTNIRRLLPPDRLDANGNIDTELKFKVTTEGIQDYYYSNGDETKPFTIVKYNMNVGDKWTFKTPSGKVVERELTEKTGKDDWYFGFFLIKTLETTEHNPDVVGVVNVKFRTNHRFGLVYAQYILMNGDTVRIGIY